MQERSVSKVKPVRLQILERLNKNRLQTNLFRVLLQKFLWCTSKARRRLTLAAVRSNRRFFLREDSQNISRVGLMANKLLRWQW